MSRSDAPAVDETADEQAVDSRMLSNAAGALHVVRETSTTVDDQLDGIADRTDEQAADAAAVEEAVSELSATIEEVAATTTEVSDRSEQAASTAADAQTAVSEADTVLDTVRSTSADALEEVRTLDDQIDRISTALAGIEDIADQTNMLALNASIEAARADGDGFAVVAEEIKSLAEEAQAQAEEIDALLTDVQTATDRTAESLETAATEVDRGAAAVDRATDRIDTVTDAIDRTADDVHTVSTAVDEQADTSETIATRVERVADRSADIESGVERIRTARSDQTPMLDEIDSALSSATAARTDRLAAGPHIPTGIDGLDDRCSGGLPVGGQAVVRHDGEAAVAELLACLCAAALSDGRAVSLTPPPTLDRSTLDDAFSAAGTGVTEALRDDRLFVLDAFGSWSAARNVFDLQSTSLSAANDRTDRRRDAPLLIVGNVAGEVEVMGATAAREARYDNDEGVFEETDTVCNVVDESVVDTGLTAFYTGAADLVVRTARSNGEQTLTVPTAPAGGTTRQARVDVTDWPPSIDY